MFQKKQTSRGFNYLTFKDIYDSDCSMQKSSLAQVDCIWLGIDDPDPKIMCCDAQKYDIETKDLTGCVEYPIPKEVLLTTRMHLTRNQSFKLAIKLFKFWVTGEV